MDKIVNECRNGGFGGFGFELMHVICHTWWLYVNVENRPNIDTMHTRSQLGMKPISGSKRCIIISIYWEIYADILQWPFAMTIQISNISNEDTQWRRNIWQTYNDLKKKKLLKWQQCTPTETFTGNVIYINHSNIFIFYVICQLPAKTISLPVYGLGCNHTLITL